MKRHKLLLEVNNIISAAVHDGVDGAIEYAERLRDMIKAEPKPLAEVDGWAIDPESWHEPLDVSLWNSAEQATTEEYESPAKLVTVTIVECKK